MPAQLRALPNWHFQEQGLVIPPGTTYDTWSERGLELQKTRAAIMWHLGDWTLWGKDKFGEMYAQAIEPYSVDSIRTAVRVCEKIPLHRRRPLPFSAHQSVCKYDEPTQDEFLDAAVEFGWTRDVLREEIKLHDRWIAAKEEDVQRTRGQFRVVQPEPDVVPEPSEGPSSDSVTRERAPAQTENIAVIPMAATGTTDIAVRPVEVVGASLGALPLNYEGIRPLTATVIPPAEEMSTDEAAEFLKQLARASLPASIYAAVEVILEEREKLLRVLKSARMCRQMGFKISAGLDAAITALDEERS